MAGGRRALGRISVPVHKVHAWSSGSLLGGGHDRGDGTDKTRRMGERAGEWTAGVGEWAGWWGGFRSLMRR